LPILAWRIHRSYGPLSFWMPAGGLIAANVLANFGAAAQPLSTRALPFGIAPI
jgi:hypothetical protein